MQDNFLESQYDNVTALGFRVRPILPDESPSEQAVVLALVDCRRAKLQAYTRQLLIHLGNLTDMGRYTHAMKVVWQLLIDSYGTAPEPLLSAEEHAALEDINESSVTDITRATVMHLLRVKDRCMMSRTFRRAIARLTIPHKEPEHG